MDLRTKNAARVARRRNDEANDALDFRFLGDEDGRHAAKCVHALAGGVACTRTYDPLEPPDDTRLYEDTGIAALYDIPGGEYHAWQLAGWNISTEGSL